MSLNWKRDQCVVCFADRELTVEHIIPKSLGGILECRLICKSCNDRFGSGFEAKARLAPDFRKALFEQGKLLEKLSTRVEIGTEYQSTFGIDKTTHRVLPSGSMSVSRLSDDSLLVPDELAVNQIATRLRKRGAKGDEIELAKAKWACDQTGEELDLGRGLVVRKWTAHPATPTFSEEPMSALVPLKIAYEFVALLLGAAIYKPSEGLDGIRMALIQQDEQSAEALVKTLSASSKEAFHGIAFMGNDPCARIQIRLVGKLAYLVDIPETGMNLDPVTYTHDLGTEQDFWTSQKPS